MSDKCPNCGAEWSMKVPPNGANRFDCGYVEGGLHPDYCLIRALQQTLACVQNENTRLVTDLAQALSKQTELTEENARLRASAANKIAENIRARSKP